MKLGFVSAILPELSLAEVIRFAADTGYECVEVMCWPRGGAERRYAGVTHLDVTHFDDAEARKVHDLLAGTGVEISGLGYYPNALSADSSESEIAVRQIERVIHAASVLGLERVNTFIGRDPLKSLDENWPRFLEIWRPLIRLAEERGVRVGIENCPMLFTRDEWPGGKNLAISPAVWRRMFSDIPSACFGLNYDPSHLVWQGMNEVQPIREFADRIFHVHAKDVRVHRERLDSVGMLAYPLEYHTPKLPGLGDVDWSGFFAALTDVGYTGPVCVEVEDRAYEGTLEDRKRSLIQSARYLRNWVI